MEPVNSCLRTVTGENAPIRGRSKVRLGIGSLEIPRDMWVADIHDECILGLDFLESQGCLVNLRIGEQEIPLKRPGATTSQRCCWVVLLEGVTLPPLAEALVPVKVDTTDVESRWGILESAGKPHVRDSLLVGRTLVDLEQEQVPLRVMNLSGEPKKLGKWMQLAECRPVECVFPPTGQPPGEPVTDVRRVGAGDRLLPHLQGLYEQGARGLTPSGCGHRNRLWPYGGANAPTWFCVQDRLLPEHVRAEPSADATAQSQHKPPCTISASCHLN